MKGLLIWLLFIERLFPQSFFVAAKSSHSILHSLSKAFTRTKFPFSVPASTIQNSSVHIFASIFDISKACLRNFNNPNLDFSAGAWSISSSMISEDEQIKKMNDQSNALSSIDITRSSVTKQSSLLRVHQLGKQVIKKIPDYALLGVLVLISSELLQREVNSKSSNIPVIFRDVANTTVLELDTKLELLTQLKWDFDPFIQLEIENLRTQPLEYIDRFIVGEILPKVDKELSPILSKLTTNPTQVKVITKNVKDLIQLISYLIFQPSYVSKIQTPLERTTSTIMESVDIVGQSVEDAVKEWNRIIEDLGKIVKAESIIQLLPPSLFPKSSNTRNLGNSPFGTLPATTPENTSDLKSIASGNEGSKSDDNNTTGTGGNNNSPNAGNNGIKISNEFGLSFRGYFRKDSS